MLTTNRMGKKKHNFISVATNDNIIKNLKQLKMLFQDIKCSTLFQHYV